MNDSCRWRCCRIQPRRVGPTGMLNELEKAHIYIERLNERLKSKDSQLPLSRQELVEASAYRRPGRASRRRTVPTLRFHRHKHGLADQLAGALLTTSAARPSSGSRKVGDARTRLSCHRFRANEVRLQLSVLWPTTSQPVAAARSTTANQELVSNVSDHLKACFSERSPGWTSRQRCGASLSRRYSR